ncbi:hypothetical protein EVAR_56995_1 [Eumeta japonica]|uniref:Uncharacterized protein n=1 Tax=Eumeta variegata TaxID=151549 RepID=A0A4C1Z933_EUMVA|nr:hypothetical protein EVAR_56995_1 [Eumeta japonica]
MGFQAAFFFSSQNIGRCFILVGAGRKREIIKTFTASELKQAGRGSAALAAGNGANYEVRPTGPRQDAANSSGVSKRIIQEDGAHTPWEIRNSSQFKPLPREAARGRGGAPPLGQINRWNVSNFVSYPADCCFNISFTPNAHHSADGGASSRRGGVFRL